MKLPANDVCVCGYRRIDHPRPDRHPFEVSDGLTNGIEPPPVITINDDDELMGWDHPTLPRLLRPMVGGAGDMKLRFDEENHVYELDGRKCKAVTSVAKIPLDQYKLNLYDQRMVVTGMARRPDLVEEAAAHIGDDKILNRICADAKKEARADKGARRGTAVHRITDRIDGGEEIIATVLAAHVQATWEELWKASKLEVIPEYMERIIVYPNDKICGKLDRIGRTAKGQLVVCDTKTGKWELAFPHSAASQLALYAHAPLLAAPLNQYGETTDFEPMPDVNKSWGVLIHMPEEGEHQTVKLNIALGWEGVQDACFPAIKWRNTHKSQLVVPLAKITPPPPQPAPDEGREMTDAEVAVLRDEYTACSDPKQVNAWIKESVDAGLSFNINGPGCRPTERRFAILRAAFAWAPHGDDITRAALDHLDRPLTNDPTGVNLGDLDTTSAQHLAELADALDDGRLTLRFADDGTPVIAPAPPHLVA